MGTVRQEGEQSGDSGARTGIKRGGRAKSGTRMEPKREQKPKSGTNMRTKWEQEPRKSGTRMETKWEQMGTRTPKVGPKNVTRMPTK